jgi:putative endonuclease
MKTTTRGHLAEDAVAKHLKKQGFEVVGLNWLTPRCEIDLIAKKAGVMYFCEVKYRGNDAQGDGFEYITSKKLSQMRFAAEVWNAEHNWSGDYRLLAAAVAGEQYQKVEFIEI